MWFGRMEKACEFVVALFVTAELFRFLTGRYLAAITIDKEHSSSHNRCLGTMSAHAQPSAEM